MRLLPLSLIATLLCLTSSCKTTPVAPHTTRRTVVGQVRLGEIAEQSEAARSGEWRLTRILEGGLGGVGRLIMAVFGGSKVTLFESVETNCEGHDAGDPENE